MPLLEIIQTRQLAHRSDWTRPRQHKWISRPRLYTQRRTTLWILDGPRLSGVPKDLASGSRSASLRILKAAVAAAAESSGERQLVGWSPLPPCEGRKRDPP